MCTVCRRRLLAGERFGLWRAVAERPHPRVVCGLCEPSARRDGWVRADERPSRERATGLAGSVRLVA